MSTKVTVKQEPRVIKNNENSFPAKKKKRKQAAYDDLPLMLVENKKMWRYTVLPTLINNLAGLQDPWEISEARIIAYLQPILDHFFPRQSYIVEVSDAMLSLVRGLSRSA